MENESFLDFSNTLLPFDPQEQVDPLSQTKYKTAKINATVYTIIGFLGLVFSFLISPLPINYFISLIVLVLGLISMSLFMLEKKRAGVDVFTFGFAIEAYIIAFLSGGLYSFFLPSFLTIIAIASILIGKRGLVLYFVINLIFLTLFFILNITGDIQNFILFVVPLEIRYLDQIVINTYLLIFLFINLHNISSLVVRLRIGEYNSKILMDYSPDGVVVCNSDWFIININKNMLSLFNKVNKYNLVGRHFSNIIDDHIYPEIGIYESNLIRTGQATINLKIADPKIEKFINVRGNLFENGKSIHIFQDITKDIKQKELESRLHNLEKEAGKTDVIKRLSGSVAHDFNNLMAKIISFSDLLQVQLDSNDPPDDVKRGLKKITEVAQRGSTLTRRLMTFSKRSISNPKSYDLVSEIKKQGNNLRLLVSPTNLALNFNTSGAVINIDLDDLDQVLINLLSNAKHVSNFNDIIEVEVYKVEKSFDEDTFLAKDVEGIKKKYVCLAVKDNGPGIKVPPRQLFNGFYSTKTQGTGLGLTIVQSILELYKGKINIKSSNEGTIFETYWLEEFSAVSQEDQDYQSSEIVLPPSKMLIIDDELSIADNLSRMFCSEGHTVKIATNGLDAINLLKKEEFDIVISDIIMPKINGIELLKWVETNIPEQNFIFMTGFSDLERAEFKPEKDISNLIIMKPFVIQELKAKIYEKIS